jgi:hypothetical protein
MAGVKVKGLKGLKDMLNPDKMSKVIRNTVNGVATAVRKESIDLAAEAYNIKKSRIRKDSRGKDTTFIKRARAGEDKAVIEYRGGANPKDKDRPGLHHFSPNKSQTNRKRSGPKVRIKRSDALKVVERGFFGIGRLQGQGIFERQEGGREIVRRTGPSTKQMVEDVDVFVKVESEHDKIFREKFNIQMKKLYGKKA